MCRRIYLSLLLFLLIAVSYGQSSNPDRVPALIPKPVSVKLKDGVFILSSKTLVVAGDDAIKSDIEIFNLQLEKIYGFKLRVIPPGWHTTNFGVIRFSKLNHDTIPEDGYSLVVEKNTITIAGKGAGIFHGLQTLLQLITPVNKKEVSIPHCEIQDFPRYGWRGMHLDVCRHFFPKEFIKKYIDLIALYKMNTFHWHLTDDQGWRLEVKKYPKLTEVGAWRNGSMIGPFNAQQFDTIRYGGFYSQDEVKEIVAYASRRHITVVPEIEMPGHSLAALASYPEFSCTGGPFEVAKAWGGFDDVFCPKEETFQFLENVLSEVGELFPGKYIHIGGDECAKVRWKNCDRCKTRMQQLNLKDENELQSYFIGRIEKFLNSKGKQIIGWDEILEGGLAPNATVMSWRGTAGGIEAAKQDHHVVMSPGSHCYFDHYQGSQQYEPLAIGGYTTVEKVYSYEPAPPELDSLQRQYILGAQGNVWTEYILNSAHVEYMALPRMAALAEVLWSPKEIREYPGFQKRLISHFSLLDRLDVNYSKSIYELKAVVKPLPDQNGVSLELSSPFTSGKIMYSLGDSAKLSAEYSTAYFSPLIIDKSCKVNAVYFEEGKQKGNILSQNFFISLSTGKNVALDVLPNESYFCSGAQSLVDGIRGNLDKHGQNWLGWAGKDMVATIDLQNKTTFSKVSLDVYDGESSWIYLPESIELLSSDDGINFTTLRKISAEEIKMANEVIVFHVVEQSACYVKVIAKNAGIIPDGRQGSGNASWLFVDEITVE